MLNIHITFFAWITEFIGFFFIFLGQFVLGHDNNLINYSLQTLTIMVYFNFLPCIFLLNTDEFKDFMTDNPYYRKFLFLFNWHYKMDSEIEENVNNVAEQQNSNEDIQ